jgi:hypothetical protein
MATNFPTGLDSYNNPTGTDVLDDVTVLHSAQHSNVNDAVEAVETKIGIDFSSTVNSLDFVTKLILMTYMQHQNGGYREIAYIASKPFINTITWYTNSSKTVKLVEKTYTYTTSVILPSKITLRLYDGTVSNTLKRTIEDTISYSTVFETSRTRVIT